MSELAPATAEGWYVLHQIVRVDWSLVRGLDPEDRRDLADAAGEIGARLGAPPEGWSALFRLVGAGADWMLVHMRPDLPSLAEAEESLARSALSDVCEIADTFLSVAEAGLYRATAEVAEEHDPASETFEGELSRRVESESENPYVRSRLYPDPPREDDYVSFYPMTKRRSGEENWYTLPIAERNRLMLAHGRTGRKYAGRVRQVITGAIGLDDWEWGVTLFAADPVDFKKIVTEMRYDLASALYGEFGAFYTGMRVDWGGWRAELDPEGGSRR